MAVTGVCPSCGAKFPLEAALQDARARQALALALKLPAPLADNVLAYLALFSPAGGRAMRADRLVRVLTDLLEPIQAAQLERKGRTHVAPVDYWRQALEEMLAHRDRLTLPLTGHGYLFSIVASIGDKAEAQTERKAEVQKSYRYSRPSTGADAGPVKAAKVIDRSAGLAGAAALKGALK